MRAADLLGGLPQAPSRRQSAAPLLLLINCVTNVTPFPQKSQTLALISREDASPKASTHRSFLSLTRFTLIYPSCSICLLATSMPIGPEPAAPKRKFYFLRKIKKSYLQTPSERRIQSKSRTRSIQIKRFTCTIIRRLGHRKVLANWRPQVNVKR